MRTNPYPRQIVDEASGISVINDEWLCWQEGYVARILDILERRNMSVKDTPLSVTERATMVRRLMDNMPNAKETDIDKLVTWAENVRTASALLDSIEAGEVKVSVKNGKVKIG